MTWEQWAMLESCSDWGKVAFNWLFLIGSVVVCKLIADWFTERWGE